ncbi:MAG: RimK family alpha-L-glutamate ligase [Fimbriimonadaceae bacterium]|nr:RimK family alpha-L-glutamate ligase [Fimbriimonadaceae bacterium]
MKIAILSTNRNCYSTRRLREAGLARDCMMKVLDTRKFTIGLEQESPDLFFRGKRLSHYDAVIPRIGASLTPFGTSVVRQFQQMGVFCANTANAISNSRDKLRCLQNLSKYDIGIAPTILVRSTRDILPAIERVGGAPVIIKLLEGTQGKGVILAETQKIAEAIIETLHGANQSVLVQKFVAESKGKDIRAFVVGDRVVASMRRVAQGTEFRSNLHRGGVAEAVTLDSLYDKTAIVAAQIMGLRVAGVDMLETSSGPQVIEVNSSPGLEGIETCTGLDVAGMIIDYVKDQVNFPELDIRERLSVQRGYGVAELYVPATGDLPGKTIGEAGLEDKDIMVLTLERDGLTTCNPRAKHVLAPGDRLLCFGRMEEMKGLVTPRATKRKRKVVDPSLARA